MQTRLLDCSLRDGGYVTQWDFPRDLLDRYVEDISNCPVDVVEIGYRSPQDQDRYKGEFFYTPVSLLQMFRNHLPRKKLAIMINSKAWVGREADLANNLRRLGDFVDLVRIAVDSKRAREIAPQVDIIRGAGYQLSINLMYAHRLVANFDLLKRTLVDWDFADWIYIVDSYGSLTPRDCRMLFNEALDLRDPQTMGFHGHNNLGLALANSLEAVEVGFGLVDGTMGGLGRGAGNAPTENLLLVLEKNSGSELDYSRIGFLAKQFINLNNTDPSEAFAYSVAGVFGFPQAEVMEMLWSRRYSLADIISEAQRSTSHTELTAPAFPGFGTVDSILIVGGGASVVRFQEYLLEWLACQQKVGLLFLSQRHVSIFANIALPSYVCRSSKGGLNPPSASAGAEEPQLTPIFILAGNQTGSSELGPSKEPTLRTVDVPPKFINPDAPLSIALAAAEKSSVEKVYAAGLDGYPLATRETSYLHFENQNAISAFSGEKIHILTPTTYSGVIPNPIFASLP